MCMTRIAWNAHIAARAVVNVEVAAVAVSKIEELQNQLNIIAQTTNPFSKAAMAEKALALTVEILVQQGDDIRRMREAIETCQ